MAAEPRPPSEQPDDDLMAIIDDGERVAYTVVNGRLLETVVSPGRRRGDPPPAE